MDENETIVYKDLLNQVGKNVIFEPRLNSTPDFLLDNKIAIEVRRLNQNFFEDNDSQGLEEVEISLFSAFLETLNSFDSSFKGETFWVGIIFKRPLMVEIGQIKKDIKSALKQFLFLKVRPDPYELLINSNITLSIFKSHIVRGRTFRPAGENDENNSGFQISVYIENISLCITEKSAKVEAHLGKYDVWRLYLVDHIGWSLDAGEIKVIKTNIVDLKNFNTVRILRMDGTLLMQL